MKATPKRNRGRVRSSVSSIKSAVDCTEKAREILHQCIRQFDAEAASLFLLEDSRGNLRLLEAIDPRENHHCGKVITVGEGISGHVAASKEPLLVADFSGKRGVISRKRKHPVDTFMSCPVLNGNSVLAVVNVAGRKTAPPFSEHDLKDFQVLLDGHADVLKKMTVRWQLHHRNGLQQEQKGGLQELPGSEESHLQELKSDDSGILKCLSQYVLIFDSQFAITYCSKEKDFSGLFGEEKNLNVLNRSILAFPFDVNRDNLKQKLEGLMRHGTPFSLNDVMLKDCSPMRVVNMFFSPLSSSQGELLGGLLLVDDNTKNYEMRQRLIDAEKFSLIGSMASMITHEVNNPLDAVMRLINLSLARIDDGDPVKDYLSEAQKGLHRIASLVSSLLGFSRKSMSIGAEIAPVNIIVDNAMSIIQRKNGDKDISINVKLAPVPPSVRTNDFYQVISNLLSNAFDAITSERGNVMVETRADDDYLHIIVEDDGCGIPEHLRDRMFDAFWTTKEYGKGTGLGLAIVKKLVELYEGTIAIESQEHVGTKVELTFPRDMLIS